VLFALGEYLENRSKENTARTSHPGADGLWLTSFGAGFSCHACRLAHEPGAVG